MSELEDRIFTAERAAEGFYERLREFRFNGDVWAVPEGTVLFAGEPLMTVRAPLMESQIPETYLLSTLTFQTLITTKAWRIVRSFQCSARRTAGGTL